MGLASRFVNFSKLDREILSSSDSIESRFYDTSYVMNI